MFGVKFPRNIIINSCWKWSPFMYKVLNHSLQQFKYIIYYQKQSRGGVPEKRCSKSIHKTDRKKSLCQSPSFDKDAVLQPTEFLFVFFDLCLQTERVLLNSLCQFFAEMTRSIYLKFWEFKGSKTDGAECFLDFARNIIHWGVFLYPKNSA